MSTVRVVAIVLSAVFTTLSVIFVVMTIFRELPLALTCASLALTAISWFWMAAIWATEMITKQLKSEIIKIGPVIHSAPKTDIPDPREESGVAYLQLLRGEDHPSGR
jgi:hypothetical protein